MHGRIPVRGLLAIAIVLAAIGGALRALPYADEGVPAKPRRIVSVNLCSDQLLLALGDREQIAGLTRNAADREMSAESARAAGLPLLRNSAEQILAIAPDMVIGMPAGRSPAMGPLKGRNYRTLDLTTAESFEQIVASLHQTAAAIGHPERGEALVTRMQQDLAAIPRPGEGEVAAYYQRRGYMTGTGTLIDELMGRVGLVNLATKLGKPALSQVSLEEMVAAKPDYLIVESATDQIVDQGTEMLHHPALRDIPRISIPQAWTVCGSPAYVTAARSIAEQIQRHERAGR